ncbi:hypothetical protein LOF13_23675 [Klebsiella pneumoniae subsp. pneumoniae]|nr:hypothetical protein [Klebsiella pneumoniae]UNA34747.1 hypothetical protein LOF13_23675 [Klebsiella pneumoniae subsp. pneumoniae]
MAKISFTGGVASGKK